MMTIWYNDSRWLDRYDRSDTLVTYIDSDIGSQLDVRYQISDIWDWRYPLYGYMYKRSYDDLWLEIWICRSGYRLAARLIHNLVKLCSFWPFMDPMDPCMITIVPIIQMEIWNIHIWSSLSLIEYVIGLELP